MTEHDILLAVQRQITGLVAALEAQRLQTAGLVAERDALREQIGGLVAERDALRGQVAYLVQVLRRADLTIEDLALSGEES